MGAWNFYVFQAIDHNLNTSDHVLLRAERIEQIHEFIRDCWNSSDSAFRGLRTSAEIVYGVEEITLEVIKKYINTNYRALGLRYQIVEILEGEDMLACYPAVEVWNSWQDTMFQEDLKNYPALTEEELKYI